MGAQPEEPDRGEVICSVIRAILLAAFVVGLLVFLGILITRSATSKGPKYTVAITGAAGLDALAALDRRPTLSPVFNLTVRINNARDKVDTACLGKFSTAAVSYGDAFLARGSVPAFCAGEEQESERDATAWGQDVVVPRFLRERLAGELERGEGEVDVQVRTPDGRYDWVLVCKAKIGGDPAPCSRDLVDARPAHQMQDLPGFSQ
ncbi:unnamed protein product [Urochloa decumbens]|uniref:Uncharacterized protein n=1 Tax=Urochloa decumbens TaxID=240449 RepID=A0ABC9D538_9POAL